jgi:hypothetical protein
VRFEIDWPFQSNSIYFQSPTPLLGVVLN